MKEANIQWCSLNTAEIPQKCARPLKNTCKHGDITWFTVLRVTVEVERSFQKAIGQLFVGVFFRELADAMNIILEKLLFLLFRQVFSYTG